MIAQKKFRVLMPSNIVKIEDKDGCPSVNFAEMQYATEVFDAVLYGLGGMTPVAFLQTAGVQLDLKGETVTDTHMRVPCPNFTLLETWLGMAMEAAASSAVSILRRKPCAICSNII